MPTTKKNNVVGPPRRFRMKTTNVSASWRSAAMGPVRLFGQLMQIFGRLRVILRRLGPVRRMLDEEAGGPPLDSMGLGVTVQDQYRYMDYNSLDEWLL